MLLNYSFCTASAAKLDHAFDFKSKLLLCVHPFYFFIPGLHCCGRVGRTSITHNVVVEFSVYAYNHLSLT